MGFFEKDGKVKVVYYQGVPTTTSNYTVLINNIAALNPDAVLELGSGGNGIAFLRNLQNSGNQFRFVFSIYAAMEKEEIEKNVGVSGLTNVFSYVPASYEYEPNFGMDQKAFRAAWNKKYPPGSNVAFGANAIYGYMTGLVVEGAGNRGAQPVPRVRPVDADRRTEYRVPRSGGPGVHVGWRAHPVRRQCRTA